ncbi:MAG: chromosome segregation protein [Firmicutes bacterium]|nr:chromosome segregation protein [Bacillota bacterium]
MFLKSIEIKGFKSFADKTEILFKDGITSIVGPNGSGKSNVSDAVRWVLGEQSVKTLRGGKMEDVIFAGTQYRRPVGLSQVSLILDNADSVLPLDYSDVTISRRLYRSGESDYFINNTRCRLKDVQELFMDTGIGREGYSIIGQGKIEAILSGKQDDKRGLLEEAAGIVKFRARKEEAEKKLANTNQNLVRIDDILATYMERLGPLEEDSKKAERFIELSEKLKTREVGVLVTSMELNDKNILSVSGKLGSLEEELGSLKSSQGEKSEKRKLLGFELEKQENSLEENNTKIYEAKAACQKLESDNALESEKLVNLDSQSSKNSRELENIRLKAEASVKDRESLAEALESKRNECASLGEDIGRIERQIREAEDEIETSEQEHRALRDRHMDMLQKISDTRNEISLAESGIVGQKAKITNLEAAVESLESSIGINLKTKSELESDEAMINSGIEVLEQQIASNKVILAETSGIILENENQLKKLNKNQNSMEANKSMLINLDKKHEGYNRAVKTLFQDIEDGKTPVKKGECFLLGDVIDVSREHETAIEIALGGSISDVITKNADVAKALIGYLKAKSMGRATFLPLNTIKPKTIGSLEALSKISGYIGVASRLIKYDPAFENAVSYLLGRTLICTDMDTALKIAAASGYAYRIVTLSGDVVNPSGSLTGGSTYHKSTNVIGRKREIEELGSRLAENAEAIKAMNSKLEENRRRSLELSEKNSHLKEDIHNRKIEITKIKGKITALTDDAAKLKSRLAASRSEMEAVNAEILECEKRLETLKAALEENSSRKDDGNADIISIESAMKIKTDFIKAQKEAMFNHKVGKAKADEEIRSIIANMTRLQEELSGFESRKAEILAENEAAAAAAEHCRKRIEGNKALLSENLEGINSLQSLMGELNAVRIKLKQEITALSDATQDLNDTISKKENEMHRLEILKGKHETEKEMHLAKLNDELGLTYAEAVSSRCEVKNMGEIKQEISSLKSEISRLGVVNLAAIEEYKEIKEKISFLSAQRDDLNSSKEELVSLIDEMINKMRAVFREHFMVIRKLFNETFCELFKGGSADLKISDGDELTGNIEIEVQPPGKKLQNINLLSGGEKGLSAIALLFAILKMKPTPFCILDEIEAALDDANVNRYAEFLKKFSKNTQFIVITHRKGTMEVSDALYGITMEEKGVSKVVSVDFSKQTS